MKCRGKRDTIWNIPRSISFSPQHFMLYCGITFGRVYTSVQGRGVGRCCTGAMRVPLFCTSWKIFMRKWMVNCSRWRVIAGYNLRLSRFFNTWVSGYIFVRYILLCTSPEWYCTLHCKCNKNIANLYCRDLVHPYHLNTWSWKWALILKLKTYYFFLCWNIFCQYCTVTLGIIFISKYFLITTFSFLSQAVLDLIKVYSKCIL